MSATLRELEEETRLERLEEFARLKFIPWLEWMAEAASLQPSDILSVLSHAVTEPFYTDLKFFEDGSCQYRRWGRFLGHTPIETACMMFVADHWRQNHPIPARDIIWNVEYGSRRAEIFRSTHKYLKKFPARHTA